MLRAMGTRYYGIGGVGGKGLLPTSCSSFFRALVPPVFPLHLSSHSRCLRWVFSPSRSCGTSISAVGGGLATAWSRPVRPQSPLLPPPSAYQSQGLLCRDQGGRISTTLLQWSYKGDLHGIKQVLSPVHIWRSHETYSAAASTILPSHFHGALLRKQGLTFQIPPLHDRLTGRQYLHLDLARS